MSSLTNFKLQASSVFKRWLIIVFLCLVAILTVFLRFYNLEKRFYFEWDQERDAYVVYDLLVHHKPTLIGPSQASEQYGFFLGPWYYYILTPFYVLTGLDPIGAGIFSGVVSLAVAAVTATLFSLFWLCKFGHLKKIGYAFGLLLVTIFMLPDWRSRYAFNAGLIPVTSGLFFVCLFCLLEHKEIVKTKIAFFHLLGRPAIAIPLLFLLFGLSIHSHFSGIFLSLPLVFILRELRKERGVVKASLLGVLLFAGTFLPLVIFDLRHNFLDAKLFFNFFFASHGGEGPFIFDWKRPLAGLLEIHDFLYRTFGYWKSFAQGLLLITLATGFWQLPKRHHKLVFGLALLPPLVLFSFYKTFQSYYLLFLTPLVVTLLVYGILYYIVQFRPVRLLLPIVLVWYVATSTIAIKDDTFETSLHYKRQAVRYIIEQKQDPVFNVSYETWPGLNKGFDYLFTYYNRRPVDTPEAHLYTITLPYGYDKSATPSAKFGNIGVIRR